MKTLEQRATALEARIEPSTPTEFSRYADYLANAWRTEADAKAYAEAKLARDNFEIGEIK
jgi:hypothetical protein